PKTDPTAAKPTEPAKPKDPSVLLDEDFRNVKARELPAGWNGRSFVVAKDKDNRNSLQTNAREGQQDVMLPAMNIQGDFFFECEFELHYPQALHIRLEHPTESKMITVTYDGTVELPGNVKGPPLREFKPNAVNRLRLLRDRNVYQVFINDAEGPSNRVDY